MMVGFVTRLRLPAVMFDDDQQNSSSFWDTATGAVGGAWDSAKSAAGGAWDAASGAASGAWDATTSAAGGAWDTVSGAAGGAWDSVTNFFGGSPQDEGPISVPVTPEAEAAAKAMVAESDRLAADPNYRSPYEQQQDRAAEQRRAYEERQAEKERQNPYNMWDAAMDKYLKGEGPSPGSRNDYIQKINRQREDAELDGPYNGQY